MKNPYEILQVSNKAEIEVIEAAYRRLARKYHPDTNPSSDATERMKDINWAYEILSDPASRRRYDSLHIHTGASSTYTGSQRDARRDASTRGTYTRRETQSSSAPSMARTTHPTTKASEPAFLRKYWYLFAVVIGYFLFIYLPEHNQSSNEYNSSGSTSSNSRISATVDPYADCINWFEADAHDGQHVCVLGRIILVSYQFDQLSSSDIWTAHFGMNKETGFRLISVDHDISKWEGQCVVVYGTIFDRAKIQEYVSDSPPSMVDSDPYDTRGFSISAAPADRCY